MNKIATTKRDSSAARLPDRKTNFNVRKLLNLRLPFRFRDATKPKKQPSEFVLRMREIDKIPKSKLIWDSLRNGTYRRTRKDSRK